MRTIINYILIVIDWLLGLLGYSKYVDDQVDSDDKSDEEELKDEAEFELADPNTIPVEEEEEEEAMATVNNSKRENYHKQTNNEIDPFISCFPTSMVNAGEVIGVEFPKEESKTGGYVQEEDAYNWFIENDKSCKEFWSKPAYKEYLNDPANHPRELWDVEEFCFNRWVGTNVCRYVPNAKVDEIVDVIAKGGAVVTSGNFCGFGHVVCIVGFNGEPGNIKDFIIDDPYGDYRTGYKPCGVGGDDVVIPKDEFLKIINKGRADKPTYNAILFG